MVKPELLQFNCAEENHLEASIKLARISHQIDEPSLALCFHKVFYSIGNTICIPLLRKMPCKNKLLRDHLIT